MNKESAPMRTDVQMHWGVKILLRDGVRLNATLYTPKELTSAGPAIFTLTPYIGQTYHEHGLYFAAHAYSFLTVDVRGRGNSEGSFRPYLQEAEDGYDIVEWLAKQPYCNGCVAMWGGSYAGYNQWTTASQFPPHLATIVPVASPYFGVDFPIRNNIATPYWMQWLTLVSGRTSQDKIFWGSEGFWGKRFQDVLESGTPFRDFDRALGNASLIFQEWVAHPNQDAYWDQYNPTADQIAKFSLPILTITGSYDADQLGALAHYREHLKHSSPEARARHFLVIGPWDHAGTREPAAEFCGIKVAPAGLLDLGKLHRDWYTWIMQGGDKPSFLQKPVAYYVMGSEKWRYSDTLEGITAQSRTLYLRSKINPTDVFHSGQLTAEEPEESAADHYVYDPRDVSLAGLESTVDWESRTDQRMLYASFGRRLVYHSVPFEKDTEISGFFRLAAWLAIDQPDTDFAVSIYEIATDGSAIKLSEDSLRARYREDPRTPKLVTTREPLRYDFNGFMFISRLMKAGHRLRLVIGPHDSIYYQRNYNSGGVVAAESVSDARPVRVRLFHCFKHASALYVPIGQPER
jgi:uncharacterized protein